MTADSSHTLFSEGDRMDLCEDCRNNGVQYPFEHELWPSMVCDYCILGSDFISYYDEEDYDI